MFIYLCAVTSEYIPVNAVKSFSGRVDENEGGSRNYALCTLAQGRTGIAGRTGTRARRGRRHRSHGKHHEDDTKKNRIKKGNDSIGAP